MARDPEKQRAAKRGYYERHRGVFFGRSRRQRDEPRRIVREAKARPCADGGGEFPYCVVDSDHRGGGGKLIEVAQRVAPNRGKDRLPAGIVKCDVVGANCQRVRTHGRGRYGRSGGDGARL